MCGLWSCPALFGACVVCHATNMCAACSCDCSALKRYSKAAAEAESPQDAGKPCAPLQNALQAVVLLVCLVQPQAHSTRQLLCCFSHSVMECAPCNHLASFDSCCGFHFSICLVSTSAGLPSNIACFLLHIPHCVAHVLLLIMCSHALSCSRRAPQQHQQHTQPGHHPQCEQPPDAAHCSKPG